MQFVHEDIEKEHHSIQNNDVGVFFQVAQFAISFQYHKFSTSKVRIDFKMYTSFIVLDLLLCIRINWFSIPFVVCTFYFTSFTFSVLSCCK